MNGRAEAELSRHFGSQDELFGVYHAVSAPGAKAVLLCPPLGQEQVHRELAEMLDRGLRQYFICSGGASRYCNHQCQFRECFGRRISRQSAVAWSCREHADHTYILTAGRLRLLDLVEHWLLQNFPVPRASAHP